MIKGVVTYNTKPVPRTEVKLFEVGIGEIAKTTANDKGEYSFEYPMDNRYILEINVYGFIRLIGVK